MAMFGIGPVELLIIGVVLLILLGAVVVPVVLIVFLRKKPAPNPNLSPCPDCGWLISRKAISCPQCGRPQRPAAPQA